MAGTRLVLLAAVAALALSGCDNGPSAVSQKQAAGTQMATSTQSFTSGTSEEADGTRVDDRRDPVKLVDGKPMWSASRRFSAQENAERAFAPVGTGLRRSLHPGGLTNCASHQTQFRAQPGRKQAIDE